MIARSSDAGVALTLGMGPQRSEQKLCLTWHCVIFAAAGATPCTSASEARLATATAGAKDFNTDRIIEGIIISLSNG
jgi:hypothetical protein